MKIWFFALALTATAVAQTYSQPVREVEKGARSAVRGTCVLNIYPNSASGQSQCAMWLVTGEAAQAVPAGKHLVVEDLSTYCFTNTGEAYSYLAMSVVPPANGQAWSRYIPLQNQATINGKVYRSSSVTSRFYAGPGSTLWIGAYTVNAVSSQSQCTVRFAGHLESE